jgi:hypothetical protein
VPDQHTWPRVAEYRHPHGRDGLIQVGVSEDDLGRLATQFEGETFQVPGAAFMIKRPVSLDPGERDLVDPAVRRVARSSSSPDMISCL